MPSAAATLPLTFRSQLSSPMILRSAGPPAASCPACVSLVLLARASVLLAQSQSLVLQRAEVQRARSVSRAATSSAARPALAQGCSSLASLRALKQVSSSAIAKRDGSTLAARAQPSPSEEDVEPAYDYSYSRGADDDKGAKRARRRSSRSSSRRIGEPSAESLEAEQASSGTQPSKRARPRRATELDKAGEGAARDDELRDGETSRRKREQRAEARMDSLGRRAEARDAQAAQAPSQDSTSLERGQTEERAALPTEASSSPTTPSAEGQPQRFTLRPYQEECIQSCLAALRSPDLNRIGVSSPTGVYKLCSPHGMCADSAGSEWQDRHLYALDRAPACSRPLRPQGSSSYSAQGAHHRWVRRVGDAGCCVRQTLPPRAGASTSFQPERRNVDTTAYLTHRSWKWSRARMLPLVKQM